MSTSNIQVRDLEAYSKGFNKGFEAAEVNRKLTSVQASIFKAIFYQEYADSFYSGVADGWQHSFNEKKKMLKQQALDKASEKEQTAPPEKTVDPRMQQRMIQMKQQREAERSRNDQEIER